MEQFKHIDNSKKIEKETSHEMSGQMRHRFLAALMVAAGVVEKPHEVHAAEIEQSMNWSEGVYSLQHDAYTAETETAVGYISMGEDGEWVLPSALERDVTRVNYSFENVDLGEKTESVDKICYFHTHPLEAVESIGALPDSKVQELKERFLTNGELSAINFPPSTTDVATTYNTHEWMGLNNSVRKISAVATPSGLWYMEPDTSSEAYQQTFDINLYLGALYSHLSKISETDIQKILIQLNLGEEEADWFESIPAEKKRQILFGALAHEPTREKVKIVKNILTKPELKQHSKYVKKGASELLENQKLVWETKDRFIESQMINDDGGVFLLQENEYNTLIDSYGQLGVKVRYVSYGDLENEPPCAGAFYNETDDESIFLIDQ